MTDLSGEKRHEKKQTLKDNGFIVHGKIIKGPCHEADFKHLNDRLQELIPTVQLEVMSNPAPKIVVACHNKITNGVPDDISLVVSDTLFNMDGPCKLTPEETFALSAYVVNEWIKRAINQDYKADIGISAITGLGLGLLAGIGLNRSTPVQNGLDNFSGKSAVQQAIDAKRKIENDHYANPIDAVMPSGEKERFEINRQAAQDAIDETRQKSLSRRTALKYLSVIGVPAATSFVTVPVAHKLGKGLAEYKRTEKSRDYLVAIDWRTLDSAFNKIIQWHRMQENKQRTVLFDI